MKTTIWATVAAVISLLLAITVLGLWHWSLALPLSYVLGDATWQLVLTKTLIDTGWILTNPFLGAPGIAHLHNNAAAQTSALHSVIMLAMSPFCGGAVRLQQTYYLLNFPLICLTTFAASRLLGIARLPAACIGILFAFTTFRFDDIIYSFLANYFVVPLALVAVIWVYGGHFSRKPRGRGGDLLLGLLFVVAEALSDGYYAFFTLLLLGFALASRCLAGDWRRPVLLLPGALYVVALIGTGVALQIPLKTYYATHRSEYRPGGVVDSTLTRKSYEAEVYSSTLVMMLAPPPNDRVRPLGRLGAAMMDSEDQARRFPAERSTQLVPLAAILLCVALVSLVRLIAVGRPALPTTGPAAREPPHPDTFVALVFFAVVCGTFGGVGALIAFVYPSIRAYDRIGIPLTFLLFAMAAAHATRAMGRAGPAGRRAWSAGLVAVTIAGLATQIPTDSAKGLPEVRRVFTAEGAFDRAVEAHLPRDAMVYQYPYSQYLYDSPFYGWGSFGGERLYLQSRGIRWSNGGAKNSPSDDWDRAVSQLAVPAMIAEAEAAGFRGFVVDRTVMTPAEILPFTAALGSAASFVDDDRAAGMIFARLPDPGYRLRYDARFDRVDALLVTDPAALARQVRFSRLVDGAALRAALAAHALRAGEVITPAQFPAMFTDPRRFTRENGQAPIEPSSDVKGRIGCELRSAAGLEAASVTLRVENASAFDWHFGEGRLAMSVGEQLFTPAGAPVVFDTGLRTGLGVTVEAGGAATIVVPATQLEALRELGGTGPLVARFTLVQEGVAWFPTIGCGVALP